MKEWITKFNEKIDSLAASKRLHYLRITGGVVWNLALIFIVAFVALGVFAVSVGAGYFAYISPSSNKFIDKVKCISKISIIVF